MKPILIFLIIICAINIGFAQDNLVENNLTLYLEGKDVNDLGRKETLRLVYQTRYQSYQDLIQIRNSLE